jgi:hypothetical protein
MGGAGQLVEGQGKSTPGGSQSPNVSSQEGTERAPKWRSHAQSFSLAVYVRGLDTSFRAASYMELSYKWTYASR